MDKQSIVCTYNGIPLDNKRKWTADTRIEWLIFKSIMLSERSHTAQIIHYMITFIWHSIKVKLRGTKKQISGCLGWGVTSKGHPNPKALWAWWNYLTFVCEGLYRTICICQNLWSGTPRIANSTISKFIIFLNPSMAPHHWQGKASFALHQHSRFFSFPDLRQVKSRVCKWPHRVSPFC